MVALPAYSAAISCFSSAAWSALIDLPVCASISLSNAATLLSFAVAFGAVATESTFATSELTTVCVATTQPLSVAFGIYRNGHWTLLANDPEPPYRAFLDPTQFKDGTKVDLVAVARSLDGRTAASKVLRYTVRSR